MEVLWKLLCLTAVRSKGVSWGGEQELVVVGEQMWKLT